MLCRLTVDLFGQMQRIDRMNKLHLIDDILDFIGLKTTDKMKLGVGKVIFFVLFKQFLNAVFADLAHALGNGKINGIGVHGLGGG